MDINFDPPSNVRGAGDLRGPLERHLRKLQDWLKTQFGAEVGVIKMYGGATAPTGYLLCNGAAVSRTVFADLFAVIGTTFGAGDGSTTFNVPEMRDRFPVGAGTTYAVNDSGGSSTVTLTEAQLPAHNHSITHTHTIAHTHAVGGSFISDVGTGGNSRFREVGSINTGASSAANSGGSSAANTGNAGSGNSHENRPPYRALTFIIKT